MTRKKGKPVNFDVIVKFFMQNYGIPTKSDIDKVLIRLDRLEHLIRTAELSGRGRPPAGGREPPDRWPKEKSPFTAANRVLAAIGNHPDGAGVAEIQAETGFGEKKIRNILYRQHHLQRIRRSGRGLYILCGDASPTETPSPQGKAKS